jgi:rSAM/selenodomain-associated transferase 1
MPPVNASPVSIAVLAKAPIPGFANTRLIPSIGVHAAAVLQERLTERAVATAIEANVGPVTLWGAPDASHDTFLKMVVHRQIALRPQPAGDLGVRMLAATAAGPGSVLVIGTDCPALTAVHLRGAARALRDEGADVVLVPAEDGGYVLIGTRSAQPQIFAGIAWSTPRVLAETRARVIASRLRLAELPPLWDVDTEADLARLEREHPELGL